MRRSHTWIVLSQPAEISRLGSAAENLSEKTRFEWPVLCLPKPPWSAATLVFVASSYTRTV